MEQIHDFDKACEGYLLGELSEPEQAQLEESYFADDALFERFLAVKDELIDAYARGDLAGEKRRRFEQHYLASEPRRQRLEEAKEFIRAISANAVNEPTVKGAAVIHGAAESWWRHFIGKVLTPRPLLWQGAIAGLLLLALAGSWILVKRVQNRRAAEQARLQNEEAIRKRKEEESRRAVVPPANIPSPSPGSTVPDHSQQPNVAGNQSPKPPQGQIASLVLLPFATRDGSGSNSLLLGSDMRVVRLQLVFQGAFSRYDVVLRTVGGEQVLHRSGLKGSTAGAGKSVNLTVDPSLLRHQDYIITLSGRTAAGKLEAIGDYYFTVVRAAPQLTPPPESHQ